MVVTDWSHQNVFNKKKNNNSNLGVNINKTKTWREQMFCGLF